MYLIDVEWFVQNDLEARARENTKPEAWVCRSGLSQAKSHFIDNFFATTISYAMSERPRASCSFLAGKIDGVIYRGKARNWPFFRLGFFDQAPWLWTCQNPTGLGQTKNAQVGLEAMHQLVQPNSRPYGVHIWWDMRIIGDECMKLVMFKEIYVVIKSRIEVVNAFQFTRRSLRLCNDYVMINFFQD